VITKNENSIPHESMGMNTRTATSLQVAATLILTIGIAIVWGALLLFSYSWLVPYIRPASQISESVQVTMDGTPVIVSRSAANHLDTSFRALDGQPLPNQREEWLTGAGLTGPRRPPGLWESPVRWTERVTGLSDALRPPISWYLIRDDEPIGRAYLVGYDEYAKLPIGYFGRAGFRREMPPEDEWFDLGRHRFDYASSVLTTSGSILYGGRSFTYAYSGAADQRLPTSLVFLIDGDRLLEIDFRAHNVRVLQQSPGLVSVAGLMEPKSRPAANAADQNTPAGATAAITENDNGISDRTQTIRIALRTADKIILLDPTSGAKREYLLPAHVRDNALHVYSVANEQLLLQCWDVDALPEQELIWLTTDGSIARRERLALSTIQGGTELEAAIVSALSLPIPIAYLSGSFAGIPTMLLQTNRAATYATAVVQAFEVTWLGLLAVPLIGAVLAWWTYRLQRKYHRPATGVWCGFVLLLGVPGFVAYWNENRRPKLEPCGKCGAVVPRDRETCAVCNTVFAPPPRLGTEILA
jgi:hypothetical protein